MAEEQDIQIVQTTLNGRAGVMPNAKREQMFCSWSEGTEDLTFLREPGELTPGWTSSQPRLPTTIIEDCPRLWLVALRGTEIYRVSDEPLTPLSQQVIENGPLPAGAIRSNNIRAYRVRVKCSSETGFAVFDLDLNQEIELWAQRIDVTLMGPPNALSVASNPAAGQYSATNLVVDSLFGCQIIPIEESKGCNEGRLTTYQRNPTGEETVVSVPRSASAVKIYQGEPLRAAPTIRWRRQIGATPLTPATDVGGINFNARESIDASAPIGLESQLITDVDPLNPRLFIMNWTIRP